LTEEEFLVKSLMDFQFGVGAGDIFTKTPLRLYTTRDEKYREIYSFDSYGKTLLGIQIRSSGKIKLLLDGAERLFEDGYRGKNILQINANKNELKGTTIFKPILKNITIDNTEYDKFYPCAGDDVLIIDSKGEFVGIGEMIVNFLTALKMRNGAICKIRKKRK